MNEREKKKKEARRREREEQCCITLNLPEYLPSEPCDDVYPLTNAHGTQASSLSSLSLFFSPPLHACLLSLFTSLSLSLSRSNLALALSARFLFSSYFASSSKLTHPFLTLCTGIPGVGVIFEDIDSSGRATGRAELPVEYYRRRRGVIDGSLLSGRWPQKEFLEIFSLPEIFSV